MEHDGTVEDVPQVQYVMEHAKYAASRGYAYGGAVGHLRDAPGPHGVVQKRMLEAALGTADVVVAAAPRDAIRAADDAVVNASSCAKIKDGSRRRRGR